MCCGASSISIFLGHDELRVGSTAKQAVLHPLMRMVSRWVIVNRILLQPRVRVNMCTRQIHISRKNHVS